MTWGEQNTEAEAWEQLDYAVLQRGVNFIDTGACAVGGGGGAVGWGEGPLVVVVGGARWLSFSNSH